MRCELVIGLLASALLLPQAAQAQLAAPPAQRSAPATLPVVVKSPPSKAQDGDLLGQSSQVPLEIANATQMIRTMAGPKASMTPTFIRCDPRTLSGADAQRTKALAPPSPNELVLGQPGQAVVADKIYFVGTSDGSQCPEIGKQIGLPPHLIDVIP